MFLTQSVVIYLGLRLNPVWCDVPLSIKRCSWLVGLGLYSKIAHDGTRFEYIFYNGALQVKTPLLFVLFEYETSSAEQLGSKGIYDNYDGYYPTKQKIV